MTDRVEHDDSSKTLTDKLRSLFFELCHHDSILWRRAMNAGIGHGPDALIRYSPPLFGIAFALALGKYRRVVRKNLRLALGPRNPIVEYIDVARVFTNFASCLTEAFLVVGDRGARLIGTCLNDESYRAAVGAGRGVVIATIHTGGWQAAGPILRSVHQADVMVVMQRERDARAQALQDGARDRAGIRVAHIGADPLDALPLLSHLRKGGIVAVQIDRLPPGMRGRQVRLFGQPWLLPEGPLQLAALSGAPILPVLTRRLGFMDYEIVTAEPIFLPRRPSEAHLDAAAHRIATEMEQFLRANPTQWFHFE